MNKLIENMNEDELRQELKKSQEKSEKLERQVEYWKSKAFDRGVCLSQIRTELQFPHDDESTIREIRDTIETAEHKGLLSRIFTES